MEFAKQLKKLRTDKGLSQEDIAQKIHVTRQAVSRWEAGSSVPDLEAAVQLAAFFDVSLDWLVLDKQPADNVTNQDILNAVNELRDDIDDLSNDIDDLSNDIDDLDDGGVGFSDNRKSFGSFLEDNWFLIIVMCVLVYMGFHGGISSWNGKFF
ncbi:helix-turn-helix transcriptional regulator [Limosilactobacillus reuteri]|uniref:helix-turn-helix transcriptional regulator n=1 Tax=Limosilactobacillus reuteri TaxID=1598 RepID=UPI001CDA5E80|nr:helix-turn-helix transcriptional regulator [Limosilactobacillus reuteri]MDW5473836.1 helix-turn-helix transcriptional regulator [Limosilactobacillus reuteri]WLC95733.1 helix-turn-helix domain-containing protein [Limosilactobacillus reuteri]WRH77879.1 helix-turn-helix transcriptional regulator [Limosilactobacillus reuteri]